MEQLNDIISSGVKRFVLSITFGAYHAYIIRQEHKQQLDSMDIRNKQQLDEIKQIVRESKRSQWF
jgi:hypothetical protein